MILSVLVLFWACSAFAQQSISGTIKYEGQAVSDANVMLMPTGKGTVTDEKGWFEFRDIPNGKYELVVSIVGYKKNREKVVVSGDEAVKLQVTLLREDQEISEVEVLAKAMDQELISQPLREAISIAPSTTSVPRVAIQKQGAGTLVEAMKFIPGGFTETRGRKVKQFFSVRGQKYPYPTYSIDGIWQKEFEETPYFFNSSNIEEIRIIRSSSALLKSLSPLAGVIDVTTRKYDKKETNIQMQYGSLNSYRGGIDHGNTTEKIDYSGGVHLLGSDGPSGRNGKEQIWNMNGAMDWHLSPTLDLSVNLFYMGGSRQLVQPVAPADPKFMDSRESYDPLKTLMASSVLKYRPNNRLTSELQFNLARRDPHYQTQDVTTGDLTQYTESDREVTIQQINALALGLHNVMRFGVLYNHWVAPDGKRFYYGRRADVHTLSGVLADQHRLGQWTLDGGFRLTREYYEEWGGFGIEGSGGKFKKVDPIKDEWQAPVWQITAGLSRSLSAGSSLSLNTAGGIVTPRKGALNTLGEKPANESRLNLDLGYVQKIQQSGSLTLTTFFSNRHDALDYSGTTLEMDDGTFQELYTNRDKRNYGLELAGDWAFAQSPFTIFSNFTLMKGQILEDSEWIADDELPQVIGNLGCNMRRSDIDLNLYLNYTGPFKNDRFVSAAYLSEYGKVNLGDFAAVDATAGYTFDNRVKTRLFVEAKNLLDKKYQTVAGYPDYGRMISVGLNITL